VESNIGMRESPGLRASAEREPRDEPPPVFLGEQIRGLRNARDWTLREVSMRSGLSVGYLSLVERNRANPSIKALHDIARTLGVNVSWFFPHAGAGPEIEQKYIVRGGRRRALNFALGITDELLSPNLSGQLELIRSRFEPGASSGSEPYTHKGEEAGLVISGELELWIGDEHFLLRAGDSFSFSSMTPHRYRNPGDHETIVIWAITPPSY